MKLSINPSTGHSACHAPTRTTYARRRNASKHQHAGNGTYTLQPKASRAINRLSAVRHCIVSARTCSCQLHQHGAIGAGNTQSGLQHLQPSPRTLLFSLTLTNSHNQQCSTASNKDDSKQWSAHTCARCQKAHGLRRRASQQRHTSKRPATQQWPWASQKLATSTSSYMDRSAWPCTRAGCQLIRRLPCRQHKARAAQGREAGKRTQFPGVPDVQAAPAACMHAASSSAHTQPRRVGGRA